MYRLVYFTLLVLITRISAGDGDECFKFKDYFDKSAACCKVHPIRPEQSDKMADIIDDKNEDCMNLSEESEFKKCSEKQNCIAKNLGMMDDNGGVDEEKVKNLFEDIMKDVLDSAVYEEIMKNCFDQKPKNPEEWCYMKYLEYCTGMQFIMGCKEWNNDKSCDDFKNSASDCAKQIS